MLITALAGTPSPAAVSRCGIAAWVSACATATLKWNAASRCRGLVAGNGRGIAPPTLLTTMSSRPKASAAALASPAAASRSLRSAGITRARRPAASTWAATLASWSALRALIATSAPASARATAAAAPSPRPAPVTTATRPVTRKRSMIMACLRPVGAAGPPAGPPSSEGDDPAQDAAGLDVRVPLVDLIERVCLGDQLIQLQDAVAVEVQHLGNLGAGTFRSVEAALDLLVHHGQHEQVDVGLRLGDWRHGCDDAGAALGRERERRLEQVAAHHAEGADDRVAHLAPGQCADSGDGVVDRGIDVRGTEAQGLLALELHRVDGDDPARSRHPRALDRVDADPADAQDCDGVTGTDSRAVDRRAEPGGDPAGDQRDRGPRDVRIHLDDRGLGKQLPFREGAELREPCDRLVPDPVRHPPIGDDLGVEELHAQVAQERLASQARRA